ncbi:hypothetical protein B0H11DRAFT_2230109 [Mycena galericulata]|nr:hypothetical protein B0H11DRAFT_2230109 [Mycena galericulata]
MSFLKTPGRYTFALGQDSGLVRKFAMTEWDHLHYIYHQNLSISPPPDELRSHGATSILNSQDNLQLYHADSRDGLVRPPFVLLTRSCLEPYARRLRRPAVLFAKVPTSADRTPGSVPHLLDSQDDLVETDIADSCDDRVGPPFVLLIWFCLEPYVLRGALRGVFAKVLEAISPPSCEGRSYLCLGESQDSDNSRLGQSGGTDPADSCDDRAGPPFVLLTRFCLEPCALRARRPAVVRQTKSSC